MREIMRREKTERRFTLYKCNIMLLKKKGGREKGRCLGSRRKTTEIGVKDKEK